MMTFDANAPTVIFQSATSDEFVLPKPPGSGADGEWVIQVNTPNYELHLESYDS
jgi:hypothetical protein